MKKIISIVLALSLTLLTMTGIMLTSSAAETFDITVTTEGNGTVSPNGIVTVTEGETQSFTITPDENYAIEYVKFNGVVVISGSAEEEVYQTPAITENSTLEVKFYDLTSDTTLLTSPLVFKGKKDDVDDNIYTFTFGKVAGSKTDISDFGVSVAGKKYSLDETAYAKAMLSGYFGIGLCDINNVLPENYIVTPYYTKNGVDSFGASTVISKSMPETVVESSDATLASVSIGGEVFTGFVPDVYNYTIGVNDVNSLPAITATVNDPATQIISNNTVGNITTIVTKAQNNTQATYTFTFGKSTLPANTSKVAQESYKQAKEDSELTIVDYNSMSYYYHNVRSMLFGQYYTSTSMQVVYFEFNLPDQNIALNKKVTLKIKSSCAGDNYPANLKVYAYEYEDNTALGDYSYLGDKLDYITLPQSKDWYWYDFDITKAVSKAIENGQNKVKVCISFDPNELMSYNQQYLDGTIANPELSLKIVANTAASRQYDGSTTVYGDGQPNISYSLFDPPNNNPKLASVSIDGEELTSFSPDGYNYNIGVSDISNIPEVTVSTQEITTTVLSNTTNGNITTIVTKAEDGTQATYTFTFGTTIEGSISTSEIKYKRRDNESDYTIYHYDDTTPLNASIRNANGITKAATLNPSALTIGAYLTFDLTNVDVVSNKDIILKIRAKINEALPTDLKLYAYEYDPTNSHKDWNNPGSSVDYGFKGEEIDSVTLLSDGEATVHADYRNFYFNVTDYVAKQLAAGETDVTICLMYGNEQLLAYQAQVLAETYPAEFITDFSTQMILNNAGIATYDGGTSVYSNGQPKLIYYEFE